MLMSHKVWLKSKVQCSKNILGDLGKYGLGLFFDDGTLRHILQT